MLALKSNLTLKQTATDLGFSASLIKLYGFDNKSKEFPSTEDKSFDSIYLPPGILGCYCHNKRIIVVSRGIWKFDEEKSCVEGRSCVNLFIQDKNKTWKSSDSFLQYSSDLKIIRYQAAVANNCVRRISKVLDEKSYIKNLWNAFEK